MSIGRGVFLAFCLASGIFVGAASAQDAHETAVIDLGTMQVDVDASQPLVSCVIAKTTTIHETLDSTATTSVVRLRVYARGLNGEYTELGEFLTEQTGPLEDIDVRECPYLEEGS